MKFAGASGSS